MFGGEYVLEGAGGCSGKKNGRRDDHEGGGGCSGKKTRRKDGHEGGARGRKTGSKNKVQRKCGFDTQTNRCNRKSKGNMNEWCTVGKKTKRCKKSSLGKKASPKNPANVARGRTQMANLKSKGLWRQKPRKAKSGPPPLPEHMLAKARAPKRNVAYSGLTCKTMSEKDCTGKGGQLMGCRWGKFGKSKKDTCGQKATASHTGPVKRPGAGRRKKKSARKPRKKSSKKQQGGAQWNYIVNPETGRKVSIIGSVGQKVLQNYVNML